MKSVKLILIAILLVVLTAQCAPAPAPVEPVGDEAPLFFAAYATPVEEPWVGVIHTALQKAQAEGKIRYEYTDDIGYAGDMERVLREVSDQQKPTAIFGDAFGNEEAVRRVAKDFPEIAFAFGSGFGPVEPNMAVFDNWIHEPAYLCGLIAGAVTKTNIIGVVGGYPVPEVNRITHGFIQGVKQVNPDARVLVTFINSWFDPAAAKEAALAQVDAGADVLFAERFGVIEAAVENNLYSFGNMSDQNNLGPNSVISAPVWNMTPTVEYVINQVKGGTFTAQDLKDFSMMGKGGAYLAPFHGLEASIPAETLALVRQREQEILDGLFRVDIVEDIPVSD